MKKQLYQEISHQTHIQRLLGKQQKIIEKSNNWPYKYKLLNK